MSGGALHLLLVAALATPPVAPDPALCAADDFLCTGKAYVAAARISKSSKERAQYLYTAHRAFLRLYDRSQDGRDLCQAHELIRQARKVPANRLGERLADSERETQSRLRSSGVECSRERSARARPPVVAALPPGPEQPSGSAQSKPGQSSGSAQSPGSAQSAPGQSSGSAQTAPGQSARSEQSAPGQSPGSTPSTAAQTPVLVAHERSAVPAANPGGPPGQPIGAATRPEVKQQDAALAKPAARSARPFLIGGGVALGASLALGALAIYFPVRATAARRTCLKEMCEVSEPYEFETKYPPYKAGGDAYERDIQLGVITGVAGGAALVTAIVLLTVGARRKARGLAVGPMIRQGAGGVLFTGRF